MLISNSADNAGGPDGVGIQDCSNKHPLTRATGDNGKTPIDPLYPGRWFLDTPYRNEKIGHTVIFEIFFPVEWQPPIAACLRRSPVPTASSRKSVVKVHISNIVFFILMPSSSLTACRFWTPFLVFYIYSIRDFLFFTLNRKKPSWEYGTK